MDHLDIRQHTHGDARADSAARAHPRPRRLGAALIGGAVLVTLPLVGLVSLLLRSKLDPHLENYRLHFVVFGLVGAVAYGSASRRARQPSGAVTRASFCSRSRSWRPADFAARDRDARGPVHERARRLPGCDPGWPPRRRRVRGRLGLRRPPPGLRRRPDPHRAYLRGSILLAMAPGSAWTVADLPPLGGRAARRRRVATSRGVRVARNGGLRGRRSRYGRSSATAGAPTGGGHRVLRIARRSADRRRGDGRAHGTRAGGMARPDRRAYLIIGFAARHEWRDERFRDLYLPTTRERRQDVSVLFGDLVGFTTFAERGAGRGRGAAQRLLEHRRAASHTPVRRRDREVHRRRHGRDFNSRGDQEDHALRASCAGLALQRELARLTVRIRSGRRCGSA